MSKISQIYFLSIIIILIISYLLHFKFKFANYIIMICSFVSSIIYIAWRFTVIPLHGLGIVIGVLLLAAELLGIIQFFNFGYLSTRKYKLEKKQLSNPYDSNLPTVDILICTYNEPIDLLRKTLIAAKNIKYPEDKLSVYICDDGKRDKVRDLCYDYDINYITRDSNEGAKAGNINNALKVANSEYVSILDADMIAKDNFLTKTMQYFLDDELLAFVQVPQTYYNADMYQYNMSSTLPNEQDLFMRDIQEARASIDAVLHVGTNAIFRRKLLDSVGGFPMFSITEDMALGMILQAKGYNSILVNEPLVLGLSATTLEESIKQRKRWARGNIQVFKKRNPLFSKGLTLTQKIAYMDGLFYWFASIQKLIYIIAPIIYLLFGILSIDAPVSELLPLYIPFLSSQIMIFKILSPGTRNIKWSHYYETVMAPSISASILTELFSLKPIGFKVTSKDITHEKAYFQFEFVLPHLILFITTIISWFLSAYLIYIGAELPSFVILNIAWSIYNGLGLYIALKVAYQKPIFRTTERVELAEKLPALISKGNKEAQILINDISDKGLGCYIVDDIDLKLLDSISITLNNIVISGQVVRIGKTLLGIKFNDLGREQYTEIITLYTKNLKPFYDLKRDHTK